MLVRRTYLNAPNSSSWLSNGNSLTLVSIKSCSVPPPLSLSQEQCVWQTGVNILPTETWHHPPSFIFVPFIPCQPPATSLSGGMRFEKKSTRLSENESTETNWLCPRAWFSLQRSSEELEMSRPSTLHSVESDSREPDGGWLSPSSQTASLWQPPLTVFLCWFHKSKIT